MFGPTPRDYTQRVQKKVRTLGKKSALNVRARENDLLVIEFEHLAGLGKKS